MSRRGWPVLALGLAVFMADAPWRLFPELGGLVLVAVSLLLPGRHRVSRLVPLALLVAWMGLGTMWSVAPLTTVRATLRCGLLMIGGVLAVRRAGWRPVVDAITLGTVGLCLASLVAWVLDPSVADADGLRGVMPHNNSLAYVAAVATVGAVLGWRGNHRFVRLVGVALAAITLVLAASMTSLLAVLAALAAGASLKLVRHLGPDWRLLFAGLGLVAVLGGALLFWAEQGVSAIGRDATLTGRTNIWPDVWRVARQHWLIGHGQGAAWVSGSWIREWAVFRFDFAMLSAHNATLEAILDLGLVGLVLVVVLWVAGAHDWVRAALAGPGATWGTGMVVFHLVHGATESSQSAPLYWLLLAVVACTIPTPTTPLLRRADPAAVPA